MTVSRSDRNSARILILCDDDARLAVLSGLLETAGHLVSAQQSLVGTSEQLRSQPCDLLLCALRDPPAVKASFIHETHLSYPEMQIIVVSDRLKVATVLECIRQGACDLLEEPVVPEVLNAAVERALARQDRLRRVRVSSSPSELGGEEMWASGSLYGRLCETEHLRVIGEATASITHEINNALGCIVTNLDFALNETKRLWGDREFAMRTALNEASAASLVLRDVVRDVRSLVRRNGVPIRELDLNEVLLAAIRLSRAAVRVSGGEIVSQLGPGATVLGNRALLTSVFVNLLLNAGQELAVADRADAPRLITVSSEKRGGEVVAEVRDTGRGIPAENLERIFEPFFSTKGDQAGTGLGLAIARRAIRQQGGDLVVRSTPGKGSTFVVTLPWSDKSIRSSR